MEIKNSVLIGKDRGSKNQFGKSSLYRDGPPGSKKMALLSVILIGAAVIIAVINGSPKPEPESRDQFALPEVTSQNPNTELELPKLEASQGYQVNVRGSYQKPIKLLGPGLIARPKISNIPPGSTVKGILLSGATNGPVKAQTTEALLNEGETVLPEGIIVLGTGMSNEDGLVVQFEKIVFQDGTFQTVQAKALDFDDQMPRLKGSKLGYYGLQLAASVGLNFAAGLADGLQEKDTNGQVVIERPTIKNALLNGSSRAALDLSQETLSSMKNKPPVVQVKSGTKILITFD